MKDEVEEELRDEVWKEERDGSRDVDCFTTDSMGMESTSHHHFTWMQGIQSRWKLTRVLRDVMTGTTRAQGKQDPENHIQPLLNVASATDAGYGTVNRTPMFCGI